MGELICFPKVNYEPGSPKQDSKVCETIPFPMEDIKVHRYLIQYNSISLKRYYLLQQQANLLNHYNRLDGAKNEFYRIVAEAGNCAMLERDLETLEEIGSEVSLQLSKINREIRNLDVCVARLTQKAPVRVKTYSPKINH